MASDNKIMITGASGFIMSNFIRSAAYEGKSIVSVDKISTSASLNTLFVGKRNKPYICDITDEHIFSRIVELEKPDVIIHAAALTSVDESITNPSEYIKNNVCGTQVVASVASKWKIPKLVYVSTDETYGHLTSETDKSWTEESPIEPRNIYSSSKACGEHIVRAYGNSHSLNYNIVRMANNYGPRQTTNKLIPRSIKSLVKEETIKIYGKGEQIRDWLHVQDSYTAISTVIDKGQLGEVYNIGAGQEFSNIEVAQLICKAMKRDLQVEFIEDRVGHDFRYSLSSDKLKKLGWEPKVKFKDGIETTVEWYMLNRHWAL